MADKFLKSLTIGGEKMTFLPSIENDAGKVWTQSNVTSGDFRCVYYGNNIWVAASSDKGLWYSIDGQTWTQSNITSGDLYSDSIAYANNIWLTGCAGDGGVYYSIDGKTWTQTNLVSGDFYDIAYGNGTWVACSGGIYYSTDGITWTLSNITDIYFHSLVYCNGIWVIGGNDGIYYSTDGMIWERSDLYGLRTYPIYYENGLWIACGNQNNGLWYSTDGMNWHRRNISDGYFYVVAYGNDLWIASSSDSSCLYYSIDGMSWTCESQEEYSRFDDLIYRGSLWIGSKSSHKGLWYSTDGHTWTQSNITSIGVDKVVYNNNMIVAATDNGLYYSQDSTPSGKVLKVINGEWAVGTLGEVESDPITWLEFRGNEEFTLSTYNTTANWDGTLYYSTDTENWNTWDGTAISSSGNKLYLRGSGNTKIAGVSTDYRWVFSGNDTLKVKAIGKIDNLLDWETVLNGGEPEMVKYCYRSMFRDCTSLVTAPELPATTSATQCYQNMFYNCTALNLYSTPTGTATYAWTAPSSAYTDNMFYNVPLDGSSTIGTPTEGTTYYWDTGSSSSGGGTELISFTINGTTYQAEEGMTWAEWCDSSYNTDGFYVVATTKKIYTATGANFVARDLIDFYNEDISMLAESGEYEAVQADEIILDKVKYLLYTTEDNDWAE